MKLSELIANAAKLLSEHGDLEVVVNGSDTAYELESSLMEVLSIEPLKPWNKNSIKTGDVKTVVIG